jgi:hypothetical protein
MVDRAVKPEDPNRDVFDLDQDERWQARLAEARARRAIALREKANLEDAPKRRPKPWELDGQEDDLAEPVEPVVEPEDDDRLDFSDRVKSLREKTERTGGNGGPNVDDGAPAAGTVKPAGRGRPEADKAPEAAPRPRTVAARYLEELAPDFEPSKPFVPEIGTRYEVASPPAAAPIARSAPLETGPDRDDGVEPPVAALTERTAEATQTRRRGMPLLLLGAVCVLAALPFAETVAPLVKGPPISAASPAFGLEPALGIMRPMNAIPRPTVSWEWVPELNRATAGPLSLALSVAPARLGSVEALVSVEAGDARLGNVGLPGIATAEPWIALPKLAEPARDRLPGAPEDVAAAMAAAGADAAPEEEVSAPVAEPVAPLNPLRVTILVPASTDAALAERIASEIRARGHQIGAIKTVDLKISARNIRYFHDEDRREAARLADAFDARLRDFTSFRPAPSEGTAEIWLSGDVLAAVRAPAPTPAPLEQAPALPEVRPQIIIVTRPASFLERLAGALGGGHSGSGLPEGSSEDDATASAPATVGGVLTGSGGATVGGTSGSGSTAGSTPSSGTGNGNGSNGQGKKGG